MTTKQLERYVDNLINADKATIRSMLLLVWAEAFTAGQKEEANANTDKQGV